MSDSYTFDYVIVGAGASGCVLANRLSADGKASVLLLESGLPDRSPLIHTPLGFPKLLGRPSHAWHYPTSHVGPDGRPEVWVRGRTLGGSSSVNGLVYWRGLPSDYNAWERDGCVGWGWKDLLPCFLALEDYRGAQSPLRGRGGFLKVTDHARPHVLCDAVLDAFAQAGTPRVPDLNVIDSDGVGYNQAIIWRGRRQSAAVAFLRPAMQRRNLRVETSVDVERVEFRGKRASTVVARGAGGPVRFHARREVILCAGALNSPKLLQLSGIGPSAGLRALGIQPVVDAPEVGANMREHRLFTLQVRLKSKTSSTNEQFHGARLVSTAMRYALTRRGPLSLPAMDVGGFVKTRPELERPDAQVFMAPMSLDTSVAGGLEIERLPGARISGYQSRPESRGRLWLTSSDPAKPMGIDPAYLSDERDRVVALDLIRLLRKVMDQPAVAPFVVEESFPGRGVKSDAELLRFADEQGRPGFHAAGTCRMGADQASVVDTRLRVRGVEGLRVADISIMPTLVSCNTNAPAMAMALRASQIILEDAKQAGL
jgi:choline dehydrogenase-like flavoprotein